MYILVHPNVMQTCCGCTKPLHASASPKEHSVNGLMKDASHASERRPTTVSSPLKTWKPPIGPYPLKERRLFATAASAALSNEMTSNVNGSSLLPVYLTNIPDRNLLPTSVTLDQASTSGGQACYAFWDSSKKAMYEQLSWLPKTASVVSDTNLWNGCVNNIKQRSWFSIKQIHPPNPNLEKTSWPSFKFIVVDGMEKGDTKPVKEVIKARKLRLRPTFEQKTLLKQYSGCSRFTYNKVIEVFRSDNKERLSKYQLRNRFVTANTHHGTTNNFFNNKPWLLECPKSIRQSAVEEAFAARQAAFTNRRNGHIRSFEMGYRSKKTKQWSLGIEKSNVSKKGDELAIFPRLLGDMHYHNTKQLHKIIQDKHPSMDCKLQMDKYGDYYLVVPCKVQVQEKKKTGGVVAIDPGIRKFLTLYSPDNQQAESIAANFMVVLKPLLLQADYLCGRMDKAHGKERDKWKQRLNHLRKRIHNLKTDLLHQAAAYVTDNYSTVLMPKLDTQQIAALSTTNKYLARELNNTRHCGFFDHLQRKCLEKGVTFLHVGEEYTSQTCPHCGALHKSEDEWKTCARCGFSCDRDVSGALCILLKAARPLPR